MIMLEFTEEEVEFINKAILREQSAWDQNEGDHNDQINKIYRCRDILDKILLASLPKTDFLITFKDLNHIISLAKTEYHNLRGDLHISNKRVEESDFKHISLANALVMWLNSNSLLKRLAKFDYTDTSHQYEGEEE